MWREGVLELLEGLEVLVDKGRIRQAPQPLGRRRGPEGAAFAKTLQFRSVRRQKHQRDAVRDLEFPRHMPARLVQDQHDVFVPYQSVVSSKRVQNAFKGHNIEVARV